MCEARVGITTWEWDMYADWLVLSVNGFPYSLSKVAASLSKKDAAIQLRRFLQPGVESGKTFLGLQGEVRLL